MSSSEFYDNFLSYQVNSGINDRIYRLYQRVCKLGITTNTSVLEIGCGIGSLTYLLSRKIKKGRIEATDISPKSIEYARKNQPQENIHFTASNALDFNPSYNNFNYILLFDVLEHIPDDRHVELFAKISGWMTSDTQLLINLPNPRYILYDQKNNPQALQETDQPIFIHTLADVLAKASLEIRYFETYSIWVKDDYHFIVISKPAEFVETPLSASRSLLEKAVLRLQRMYRNIKFTYPK